MKATRYAPPLKHVILNVKGLLPKSADDLTDLINGPLERRTELLRALTELNEHRSVLGGWIFYHLGTIGAALWHICRPSETESQLSEAELGRSEAELESPESTGFIKTGWKIYTSKPMQGALLLLHVVLLLKALEKLEKRLNEPQFLCLLCRIPFKIVPEILRPGYTYCAGSERTLHSITELEALPNDPLMTPDSERNTPLPHPSGRVTGPA